MNIEKKNVPKRSSSRMLGINTKRLVLSMLVCVATLTGCASSPITIAPDCPKPVPIPATLSKSDSPVARDYSKKVQNYLLRVQDFLRK